MPGIETGLDRRGAMPHGWEGRPEDLPLDPQYALTADKLNANWRQLMEAIGAVLITGQMCEEGTTTYGASTTAYCRLTLPDGFTEQYDVLHIGDGSRQWHVEVAVANEISFSDAELVDGTAGTANYNTIQNDLVMLTLTKVKLTKTVTKNEIVTGDFADGLHADDIQLSAADATTIKAKTDLFDVEHETDGAHSAGIIGNAELDKDDVLITQSFVNRCKNGDFNINNAASRAYWTDVGTPTVAPTAGSKTAFPQFFLDIDTDALDEGIFQSLGSGFEPGTPVRMVVYLKGDVGGEAVKIQLYTGVESNTQEITLTTGWVKYYLTLTPTNLTVFEARIVSNTASTINFYAAQCLIAHGDIHTLPERSSQDVLFDACHHLNFYIPTLVASGDKIYAKFTPKRAIKMIGVYAYANVKPTGADTIIRLTDGTNNVDVTIANGANQGTNTTTTQEFAAATELTVKVLSNAASDGTLCNVVYVYRQM